MTIGDPFMPTRATNTDRARIVRSMLSLAVVGTLLVATLVPLPGLHGRLKDAASPSVALCDWERRNWDREERERLIAEIFASRWSGSRFQQLPATDELEIDSSFSPYPTGYMSRDDAGFSPPENGDLDTDQQPDDGGELLNSYFTEKAAWTTRSISVPEYDQIYKEQQTTADLEKRKELLQKFAKLESENFEMVPLFWCSTPYAINAKRVKDWKPALGSGNYLSLATIELAQ